MAKLIKVCGMRDHQNILAIAGLKPAMMGFIFFRESKRFIGDDFSMPELSTDIEKVGVFVDAPASEVLKYLEKHQMQTAQLHGKETPETCLVIQKAGFKVMKAFGIAEHFDWKILRPYIPVTHCFVFDTKTPQHGGSGQKFNWSILDNYTLEHPFLLSGGITPDDAGQLLQFTHPQCIGFDINSGFEIRPGLKDPDSAKAFIQKINRL